MGKPSFTNASKSNSSFRSRSLMNIIKDTSATKVSKRALKRQRVQTRKKFNKLLSHLQMSLNDNKSNDVTAIELNSSSQKRKNDTEIESPLAKRVRTNASITSIVINDDDDLITSTMPCAKSSNGKIKLPTHCSTPIHSKVSSDIINISSVENGNNNVSTKNKTQVINRDSYLTIDLTTDSKSDSNINQNTVIDLGADKTIVLDNSDCMVLNNTSDTDCILISADDTSTMSGDSQVTIIRKPLKEKGLESHIRKISKGISKLKESDKDILLQLITQNIFNGCKKPASVSNLMKKAEPVNVSVQATEDDVYIKDVIVGQSQSYNSIGSNIYNPNQRPQHRTGLRMVVIDGSNVAMGHGKHRIFSVKGLKICIDYFRQRGHVVKAFVPRFRCKFGKSSDPKLLDHLEMEGYVVYTPSREIQGKTFTSYDDRYIIQCAAEFGGVIVSGDNYRDLLNENPRWRFVIENRVLPFTFVDDMIMFPKDPFGRNGPTLEQLLRHPPGGTDKYS